MKLKTYLFSNPQPELLISSDCKENAEIAYRAFSGSGKPETAAVIEVDDTKSEPDVTFVVHQDMTGIKDSLQFDSGTDICSLKTAHGYAEIVVQGCVNIEWCPEGISTGASCDRYRYPSEFPKELKELIASGADFWNDDRVYICENNWFEVFIGDGSVSDVVDVEGNTNEDLLSLMYECIESDYEYKNKKED